MSAFHVYDLWVWGVETPTPCPPSIICLPRGFDVKEWKRLICRHSILCLPRGCVRMLKFSTYELAKFSTCMIWGYEVWKRLMSRNLVLPQFYAYQEDVKECWSFPYLWYGKVLHIWYGNVLHVCMICGYKVWKRHMSRHTAEVTLSASYQTVIVSSQLFSTVCVFNFSPLCVFKCVPYHWYGTRR